MKKALIFYGGWEGHEPAPISARFENILKNNGFVTDRFSTLDCLSDKEKLAEYDLICPVWTMGELPNEFANNISYAVTRGTGIAGCHISKSAAPFCSLVSHNIISIQIIFLNQTTERR